jgi:uncharacterized membrane protein
MDYHPKLKNIRTLADVYNNRVRHLEGFFFEGILITGSWQRAVGKN